MDFDSHSNIDEDSQSSYVSRIFPVSSIFEDGYQNPYNSDDKNGYQTWNSQDHGGESMVTVVTNGGLGPVINEQSKNGSLDPQNGFEVSFEHDENHVTQAWNSQYFQGESMVVVSPANYAFDECDYKPLGLPVRSLKSRIRNPDSPQFSDGSEPSSSFKGSSSSSGRSINDKDFGDTGAINLEEKFNETVALPSQTPWRSISGRMEIRENVDSAASRPSHFRPLSVDETQFESLKSQSFRSTTSFSSQGSSMSYSPTRLSPPHSVLSELPDSKMEELGKQKSYRASYPPASQSPSKILNGGPPLNAFHLRRYSSGSLFQKDLRGRLKDQLKDLGGNRREDSLGSTERGQGSSKLDKKPATLAKALSRGKSVRTIRARGYTAGATKAEEMSKNHIDEEAGRTYEESKVENAGKNEMKGGLDSLSIGTSKKDADTQCHMPKPAFVKYQTREKEESSEMVPREFKEDSEFEIDSFPVRSDEGAVAHTGSGVVHDPSEVDKKAGEFIAKFREQIRLQKVASIDRSKGMHISGNYFR